MGVNMKAIANHFADELKTAGLTGLPFSWGSDGQFCFGPSITSVQRTAIQAVYEAHNPDDPRPVEIAQAKAGLEASDKRMARFAEDLFDALVAKGILHESDLPYIAIVSERKNLRAILKGIEKE